MTSTQVFDPEGDLTFVLTRRLSKTERVYAMIVGKGLEAGEEAVEALQIGGTLEEELDFEDVDLPPAEEQIQMLVSSKHLSLASSVFRAMFKNNLREGLELQSSGKAQVPLPEGDLEAFTILMSIIHARSRQIPRKVKLSLLLKLAILVDKYQLLEAVSAWGDIWIAALRPSMPRRFCNDLISWLCITWVFRCPDEFQAVTLSLERESPEPNLSASYGKEAFETLPIPDIVLARIKRNRHAAIECLFRALNKIIQNLTKPWVVYCEKGDTQCEGMILGTLLRSASQLEIWPIPDSPYHNMSYSLVAHKMRSLTATSYCFRSTRFKKDANPVDVDRAGILDNIERLLLNVESLQFGLSLEDYPKEGDIGDGGESLEGTCKHGVFEERDLRIG